MKFTGIISLALAASIAASPQAQDDATTMGVDKRYLGALGLGRNIGCGCGHFRRKRSEMEKRLLGAVAAPLLTGAANVVSSAAHGVAGAGMGLLNLYGLGGGAGGMYGSLGRGFGGGAQGCACGPPMNPGSVPPMNQGSVPPMNQGSVPPMNQGSVPPMNQVPPQGYM